MDRVQPRAGSMVKLWVLRLQTAMLFLLAGTMGVVPRLTRYGFILFVLLLLVGDYIRGRKPSLAAWKRPSVIAALAFCGYAFISLAWAPALEKAFANVLFAAFMLPRSIFPLGPTKFLLMSANA